MVKKLILQHEFQKWLHKVVIEEESYTWDDIKKALNDDCIAWALFKEFIEMEFYYAGFTDFIKEQLDEFSEKASV